MISGPLGPTRQPLATPRPYPKLKSKWGVSQNLRSRVFGGGGGGQGLKRIVKKIESGKHSETFRDKLIKYVLTHVLVRTFQFEQAGGRTPDGHLAVENDLPGDHICPCFGLDRWLPKSLRASNSL